MKQRKQDGLPELSLPATPEYGIPQNGGCHVHLRSGGAVPLRTEVKRRKESGKGQGWKMKLFLVLSYVLACGFLAAGEFRMDLISLKSNIDLEIRKTSEKFKVIDSPWYKEKRRQSIEIRGETSDQWKAFSFTFVPKKSGEVILRVSAPYVKPGQTPKVCAYDDFKIEGAELKNGGFEEKVPAHGWIPGWGTKDGLMTGDAAEGNFYMRAAYRKAVTQTLNCREGVPVTISFQAKNAVW